jgi:hypothetical protein
MGEPAATMPSGRRGNLAHGHGAASVTILIVNGSFGLGDEEANGRGGLAQLLERLFGHARLHLQDDVIIEANASGTITGLQRSFEGHLQDAGDKEGARGVALAYSAHSQDRHGVRRRG